MPITIPPFVQYQAALIPIAGRWNNPPPEGDKFISVEIDWGATVPIGRAVQINLNAGPVEFTQIVALAVDNGRSGSDVSFLFPDTGKQLTVPAFAQGTYPVFTSSLSLFVVAEEGLLGDTTVFEILNSMPPPVSVLPSQLQSHSGVVGMNVAPNGSTNLVPAGTNGTLQGFNLTFDIPAGVTGNNTILLQDGMGNSLWASFINGAPTGQAITVTQSGLQLRFANGLYFVVANSTLSAGGGVANVYYSVP